MKLVSVGELAEMLWWRSLQGSCETTQASSLGWWLATASSFLMTKKKQSSASSSYCLAEARCLYSPRVREGKFSEAEAVFGLRLPR